MKKTLLLIALMLCCAMSIFAQNDKISYQAVVRDTENKLVANKSVQVTVNIYNGTATTAAYTETQTVTTNYNGLISLLIGPDGNNAGWNSIQWNKARIETTVKLDGTELGTLAMPLTAVPYAMYAKYADNVDPAAIAAQMHDTANNVRNEVNTQVSNLETEINNLSNSVDNGMNALSNRIAADSNNLVNFKAKENADSLALANQITTLSNSVDNKTDALSNRITADSNRLVNLANSVDTRIDSLRYANDTAQTNIRAEIADAVSNVDTKINNLASSVDTAKANIRGEVSNAVSSLETNIDNLASSVDTAKTNIRNEIAALSQDVATNYVTNTTALQIAQQIAQQLTNTLNTLNGRIDSVINVMNNLPTRMVEERDTVQTAGQTEFTLAQKARTDCVVKLYINGVMVGGNYNGVVTVANDQTTVTYVPAQNGNYALKADDKVTIVYWY